MTYRLSTILLAAEGYAKSRGEHVSDWHVLCVMAAPENIGVSRNILLQLGVADKIQATAEELLDENNALRIQLDDHRPANSNA